MNIDLVKFRLERDLNGEHLETRQYSSLQDLIANELEILDFSDLVHVSDEDIEQYRWHNREEATEKALETVESVTLPQENKALYSVGDTVYLDNKPFEKSGCLTYISVIHRRHTLFSVQKARNALKCYCARMSATPIFLL